MFARRASVAVRYRGVDITEEVSKDLLSFEYVDNASGESDSVSLSLKDEKHIWLKDWFPDKGDAIYPTILTADWRREGDRQQLPCGLFLLDEPEYNGRPSTFTLNAIASPLNSNFSETPRSRVWRGISLKALAGDIASRAGLTLQFIGNNNPRYSSKEQTETSDSSFLSELCEDEGLAMKVTDSKIVIFDEREFEKREEVATLKESNDIVLSYSFKAAQKNTAYAGVNVRYYDAKLGRAIKYLFSIEEINEDSKIFQLKSKVRSGAEARRLAQKTLRKLNKREVTVSLTVVGNVEFLGGVCVYLSDFGAFSGKYYIQKATHTIGNGYTTAIEARKVLEGY